MLAGGTACIEPPLDGLLLPGLNSGSLDRDGLRRLARIAHVTDTHAVDSLSPARLAGGQIVTRSAWRPYEAYSTQLFDGIVRTVNRIHASGKTIDFLLHTGDAADNVQSNELDWALTVLEGGLINPLSGPDDRPVDRRPPTTLDPYAAFVAQGLYRRDLHGDAPTIPWYALLGNHDVRAIGVFPISTDPQGRRTAPLPLTGRPGLLLATRLDPTADAGYGVATPANPGPPALLEPPRMIVANEARAYFDKNDYRAALIARELQPPRGHGVGDGGLPFAAFSASPAPGLRLIGLDTTDAVNVVPAGLFVEGAISRDQMAWFEQELRRAADADEWVIVATHHPSDSLLSAAGNETPADAFRAVLRAAPRVVLHLCGHKHRHRVVDRGGYLEIETCATIDPPQEARLVELWQDDAGGPPLIVYDTFSHLDNRWPPLGDDPLEALRIAAQLRAGGDKTATHRQLVFDATGADPAGRATDRSGRWRRNP